MLKLTQSTPGLVWNVFNVFVSYFDLFLDNPLSFYQILELKKYIAVGFDWTKKTHTHKLIHQESWQNLTEKKSSWYSPSGYFVQLLIWSQIWIWLTDSSEDQAQICGSVEVWGEWNQAQQCFCKLLGPIAKELSPSKIWNHSSGDWMYALYKPT